MKLQKELVLLLFLQIREIRELQIESSHVQRNYIWRIKRKFTEENILRYSIGEELKAKH
jgi:hypothetical protein